MRKIKKYSKPVVRINPELSKYKDHFPFPEKLAMVNEHLKDAKLPEEYYRRQKLMMEEENKPYKK